LSSLNEILNGRTEISLIVSAGERAMRLDSGHQINAANLADPGWLAIAKG